jgi:hypothetical protein
MSAPILAICLIFFLSFVTGYYLAYQQSAGRAREEAQLSLAHLFYVLQLKDDMGLIDWSKSLEKDDDFLAYDVRLNGISKESGGNKTILPQNPVPGLVFQFPSQWNFHWTPQNKSYDALLVFEAKPLPWLWGLAFSFCSSFGYILFIPGLRRPSPKNESKASLQSLAKEVNAPPSNAHLGNTSMADVNHSLFPFLVISQDQEILQSSPSLSGVFGFFQPGATIFFDLEPSHELTEHIKQGLGGRVENAFKKAPGQGATVKPIEVGMLLVLEPSPPASPP